MGNAFPSRCKFNGGYIYVRTDRPYYYPGDEVFGKIYIRCEVPLSAAYLELGIKGDEKCSYWHTVHRKDKKSTRVKKQSQRKIIEWRGTCFTFTQLLNPGDYQIPFSFVLPPGLPASIMFKNFHHVDKPKAKIAYYVNAILHNHDGLAMSYRQMLVIHQPPVPFQQDSVLQNTSSVTTWCCVEQGSAVVKAQFEKNVFFANEIANALVTTDNSKCNLRVQHVEFAVRQKILIMGRDFTSDVLE